MEKKKNVVMILGVLLAVLILGAGIPLYITMSNKLAAKKAAAEEAAKANLYLGRYSEYELFQGVPIMAKEDAIYTEAAAVGGGDYLITAENTSLEDYQAYLSILEKNGFEKILDNGEKGIEGYVYTAHYQKGDLLLIVSHIVKLTKTTITANAESLLSERLFYDEAVNKSIQGNEKTKLHVTEMKEVGGGFVLQLKNGHFLLYDGGRATNSENLLSYLESLVPAGEKPIVDAWIFSHSHSDHIGVLKSFADNKNNAKRIYVESVYYTNPGDEIIEIYENIDNDVKAQLMYLRAASELLESSSGTKPPVYRMRLGERYYFSDFTMDVIFTPELLELEAWETWNSSSVVLMFTIEGQKVLFTGDADWCCQLLYTDMYDSDYFDLTIYGVPHHGINVYKQITYRLGNIQTAIYPTSVIGTTFGAASYLGRKPQNEHLVSVAQESLTWGDGTKILTFPYQIGTYESLPQLLETEEE